MLRLKLCYRYSLYLFFWCISTNTVAELQRACLAAWLHGDPQPDDAIKFNTDVEGIKAGMEASEALKQGLNITNGLLDYAYSKFAPALCPAASR